MEIDTDKNSWKFSVNNLGELRCSENAEELYEFLEALEPQITTDWKSPRLLNTSREFDIIMLDLRLWTNSEERKKILTRILKICAHLGADRIADESNEIFDPEFKRAFERANALLKADNNIDEVEAIALFPLLLSYYDPSLPIILFSSTHQRAIFELTSHRPNIITDFAKPILSGYGEENNPGEFIKNLIKAVTRAVELHELRFIWDKIGKSDWQWSPVFEVRGKARNTMEVYNSNTTTFDSRRDPKARVAASQQQNPKISGQILRNELAQRYFYYLENPRYFDFATVPWELLEGNLVPDSILTDPQMSNPSFSLSPELSNRNYIAQLLESIRNKKAHGGGYFAHNVKDKETYRICAALQFMFLLDFLNEESSNAGLLDVNGLADLKGYLKKRYPHLKNIINYRDLEPRHFTADSIVDWLDFIVFSACYALTKAKSNDGLNCFASADTIKIVNSLIGRLVK